MLPRLLAATVLVLVVAAPAAAQDASVQADGWWNLAYDYSFLPVVPPVAPPPPPTNIPEDAIATSHNGAEVDKLAAISFFIDAPLSSTVDEASLVLAEYPDPSLTLGDGTVSACAADSPWLAARNGEWNKRPEYDCSHSAPGTRSDDGLWSFDIAPIAQAWLDGTLLSDGIVFVVTETVQPTQVAFEDTSHDSFALTFRTTPPAPEPEPQPQPEPASPTPAPVVPAPAPVAPPPVPTPAPAVLVTTPTQAQPEVITDPDLFANLLGAGLLFFPLLLGLGAATSFVLGPAGVPVVGGERRGAVSRALGTGRDTEAPPNVDSKRQGAVGKVLDE